MINYLFFSDLAKSPPTTQTPPTTVTTTRDITTSTNRVDLTAPNMGHGDSPTVHLLDKGKPNFFLI